MSKTRPLQVRLQPRLGDRSAWEIALGLSHLPGLVFLDSSSSENVTASGETGNRCSIVAARPQGYHSGNINSAESRSLLKTVLKENVESGLDLGFPAGGLVGWIGYEGEFFFGNYPEMLVYDHVSGQWFERGDLSEELRDRPIPAKALPEIDLDSTLDRDSFCDMVRRAQEYISAGDIYQVNLSRQFEGNWPGGCDDALPLYGNLREISPVPFAALLSLGGKIVLSASPEQFLRISGRTIETRPIKGTRPRFRNRERDEKSAYDLITSPKEISELIMITDLERNDLGQICEFGSVEVTELLKLERFAQVFHLVSTVEGTLRRNVGPVEALAACFPGGSITGAPKKRAREIIEELENAPRGLYTGTVGCFGFNGESVFNIAIRTAVIENGAFHFHAGAGIVADSQPEMEWEETQHKAAGILGALSSPD